jgi:hypothetical protein
MVLHPFLKHQHNFLQASAWGKNQILIQKKKGNLQNTLPEDILYL